MLTRSTRSGAASHARDRLTGTSHGHSLITHGCSLITHGCSLITHGCRLYAQGLANVAPPLVLDTAAAAEQRPQQVGTRPLLYSSARRPSPPLPPRGASPGLVPSCHSCHPCLLGGCRLGSVTAWQPRLPGQARLALYGSG